MDSAFDRPFDWLRMTKSNSVVEQAVGVHESGSSMRYCQWYDTEICIFSSPGPLMGNPHVGLIFNFFEKFSSERKEKPTQTIIGIDSIKSMKRFWALDDR